MTVDTLLSVPRERRDAGWVESLYAVVAEAPMTDLGPVMGPDGFGYAALTPGGTTQVRYALHGCLDQGLGIVLVTVGDAVPQWVFPYGNLWSYKEHGAFVLPDEPAGEPSGQALVGSPSEDVLPPYARRAIKAELLAQGATDPGVLLVDVAGGSPPRSLAFAPMPDPQRILWYLPPHLGLMAVADGWPDPMPL